jgi:hypothetical protein
MRIPQTDPSASVRSTTQLRKEYRVGFLDDQWGLFDVHEGGFEGDELKVGNERARTWGPAGSGPPAMDRIVLKEIEPGVRFVWSEKARPVGRTGCRPVCAGSTNALPRIGRSDRVPSCGHHSVDSSLTISISKYIYRGRYPGWARAVFSGWTRPPG